MKSFIDGPKTVIPGVAASLPETIRHHFIAICPAKFDPSVTPFWRQRYDHCAIRKQTALSLSLTTVHGELNTQTETKKESPQCRGRK